MQKRCAGLGACHGRVGVLPWGLHLRFLAKQGLKAFFSPIEVSLCQYNRGVSAAPALRRGSWASCQSQYRPWKKRQHQAPSLELCMRRSAYPNLRFPEGTCPGTCMEPAPSCACSTRPCPSRMPGPASLPLWSAELSKGVGAHHYPRGASLGEQAGLVSPPAHSPEERQHPRALAWPMAWVQPGGTRLLPRRYPAADLALSRCVSLGVGWGGCRSYSPFGSKTEGVRQCRWPQCCQGSQREVAAGFGKSWRGVGRGCLWGWAHLVQLTKGIPDGGQASLHPITAVQGLSMPLPAAVHENSNESMRS